MSKYSQRLRGVYERILETKLASHHDLEGDSLRLFQEILNEAVPRDEAEKEAKNILREIYSEMRSLFREIVKKKPHLVLVTDPLFLVNTLELKKIVFVKWEQDHYEVIRKTRSVAPVSPMLGAAHENHYHEVLLRLQELRQVRPQWGDFEES